jgi:hypothetical protein
MVASLPILSAVLIRLFSRSVSSSDSRMSMASSADSYSVLEASDDMVQRFECTRHLQADEIMTDAVDHRRHGIEGRGHGRFSRAMAWPTAS